MSFWLLHWKCGHFTVAVLWTVYPCLFCIYVILHIKWQTNSHCCSTELISDVSDLRSYLLENSIWPGTRPSFIRRCLNGDANLKTVTLSQIQSCGTLPRACGGKVHFWYLVQGGSNKQWLFWFSALKNKVKTRV